MSPHPSYQLWSISLNPQLIKIAQAFSVNLWKEDVSLQLDSAPFGSRSGRWKIWKICSCTSEYKSSEVPSTSNTNSTIHSLEAFHKLDLILTLQCLMQLVGYPCSIAASQLQGPQVNSELPIFCLGFLWVLLFPPTYQKYVARSTGNSK